MTIRYFSLLKGRYMSSAPVIDNDTAANRRVSPGTRSPMTKEQLAESLVLASEAQADCASACLEAHVSAGSYAATYIAASVAGITTDRAAASLLAQDAIIDASHDGRDRNQRRQEIRRQVCLSHIAGILSIDGLPLSHALELVGAKVVYFVADDGAAQVNADYLSGARQAIVDYHRAKCNRKAFRENLRKALGKPTSKRTSQDTLLETLRQILADESTTEERRKLIIATHPELDPKFVDPAEVTTALNSLGKLTAASQLACVIQFIATHPDMQEAILNEVIANTQATA